MQTSEVAIVSKTHGHKSFQWWIAMEGFLAGICCGIRDCQFRGKTREELRDGVQLLFERVELKFERDFPIPEAGEVEFFLPDEGVAVVISIGVDRALVLEKLYLLASSDAVNAIVLLSDTLYLPSTCRSKPVRHVETWAHSLGSN